MAHKADVLIIAVTDVEFQAIIQTFNHAGNTANAITIDDRVYQDLGDVNGSKIFLALSEMGAGGVGGALQTVQKAVNTLSPNAVFMVGIAFGVSEEKQKIGDVLVSQQLRLYELQRKGEQIHLRGDKPHASPRLINFCRTTALTSIPSTTFKIRFGLLLTGEKLIDDINYRNQLLSLDPEAIGGEMEGSGLYVACNDSKTDWIVIKAICDWADGNKSNPDKKDHQFVAATNAANFAFSVLQTASFKQDAKLEIPRDTSEKEMMLLLRLYDFQGTCIIGKAKGEQEHLRVPGHVMDMQWGASSNDNRLSWIYVVRDLCNAGLLEKTGRDKEYKLTDLGEEEAWKLSLARGE